MKRVWVIEEGSYYYSNYSKRIKTEAYTTKDKADKACKLEGFKYCREEQLYYDDKRQLWRTLTRVYVRE